MVVGRQRRDGGRGSVLEPLTDRQKILLANREALTGSSAWHPSALAEADCRTSLLEMRPTGVLTRTAAFTVRNPGE